MNEISISTGLYTNKAKDILRQFMTKMKSDQKPYGWTNIPVSVRIPYEAAACMSLTVDSSGEVFIRLDAGRCCSVTRWYKELAEVWPFTEGHCDVTTVRKWFSDYIAKFIATYDCQADDQKIQICSLKSALPVRCRDIIIVKEHLAGVNVTEKYGEKACMKVVGQMADPVKTEINLVIKEETKKIHDRFVNRKCELHNKYMVQIMNQVRAMYNDELKILGKEERAAVTAMKKQFEIPAGV